MGEKGEQQCCGIDVLADYEVIDMGDSLRCPCCGKVYRREDVQQAIREEREGNDQ